MTSISCRELVKGPYKNYYSTYMRTLDKRAILGKLGYEPQQSSTVGRLGHEFLKKTGSYS